MLRVCNQQVVRHLALKDSSFLTHLLFPVQARKCLDLLFWLKRQVLAREGGNLPEMEKLTPLPPNYCNFEIPGLSGKDVGEEIIPY